MSCVLDYGSKPLVFRCTHCNNTMPCSLPLGITQFVALSRMFEEEHRDCWKNAQPKKTP
jgi:hypothetical protein